LSADPGSENNTQVYVSGVYQEKDTYSVSGTTLTFSTAPPTGTSNIEVVSSAPLAIGTPSDGTVTTAKLASITGSGAVVLATSPTLVTPALGTPSALVLTNATGLPQAGLASGVAGNGPAFSAYNNATQSVTSSTYTKVNLQLEEFDTASCFDNATNYRFTPTVAGYYQVNGEIGFNFSTVTRSIVVIYKNGSSFKFGGDGPLGQAPVSALIYMNGSTDYIELYGWINGTGPIGFDNGTAKATYFQASMVRSA
jgi:hypothetical protein